MRRSRRLVPYLAAGLCLGLFSPIAVPAQAAPNVKVGITIERVKGFSTEDLCGDPDWYVKGSINGQSFNNFDDEDNRPDGLDITPDWEFSVPSVDVATLTSPGRIPFSIELWDEDGGFCVGDEQFDISPVVGRPLDGFVFLGQTPCSVHDPEQNTNPPNFTLPQGFIGGCNTSITQSGTAEDRAEITFRIAVEDPPSAPNLRVRCMHSPVWPQPGQPVTITATALDGALQPTIVANNLEIWVDPNAEDEGGRVMAGQVAGAGALTHTFTPGNVRQFGYGCRLRQSLDIFSGWRRATVGDPFMNSTFPKPALPILYTGPRSSRIDIVFIADRDSYMAATNPSYPGASDPQFQRDVEAVINTSYYGFNEFLAAQDKFNFWILLDNPGRAADANDGCDHELPVLWDEISKSINSGGILHRKNLRDCAKRSERIFSSVVDTNVRSDAFQVVTHETSHSPFGLSDEYCCDSSYFQPEVAPNVYENFVACVADAPALGRTGASCRKWEADDTGWFDHSTFWTSEPGDATPSPPTGPSGNDDVMNDNGPANAADRRRYDLIFGDCGSARC